MNFRRAAVEIARDSGKRSSVISALNNWLYAWIDLENYEEASRLANEIDREFAEVWAKSEELRVERAEESPKALQETWHRFLSHKAKLRFMQAAKGKEEERSVLIAEGNDFYRRSVDYAIEDVGRRVNTQTEWADRLIDLKRMGIDIPATQIDELLSAALRSLDLLGEIPAIAYYYFVRAQWNAVQGDSVFDSNEVEARRYWRAAVQDCLSSERVYQSIGHHLTEQPQSLRIALAKEITMSEAPRMVFLSHKGVDKKMVRRFAKLLEELGYEPWLDEEQLTAATSLHRGIFEGFQNSCACVFFITKNFRDESYIKAEIDHAMSQYTEKGRDKFRIITLAIGPNAEDKVPAILKRWVFKSCAYELDAMYEIVRALPVRLGTVRWRAEISP